MVTCVKFKFILRHEKLIRSSIPAKILTFLKLNNKIAWWKLLKNYACIKVLVLKLANEVIIKLVGKLL